jgi:23S rRNA pseudouridine2605 synthase
MTLVRLNKYLAERGVASRRKCDELIEGGSVLVDGEPVTELGTRIDPETARVEVDGRVFDPERPVRPRYYLLHKPRGVICTNDRFEGRKRAIDLVTDPDKGRIYTVGRLDEASTGLIVLTSDGDFANLIAHPRNEVPKTYMVKVKGKIDGDAIEKLKKGVYLAEGRTEGFRVRVLKRTNHFSSLSVTLAEGKNREVRRVFARVGFNVLSLRRTRIGNLSDPRLKEGQWRPLRRAEVAEMVAVAQGEREAIDDLPRGPRRGREPSRVPPRLPRGKPSPDRRDPRAPKGRPARGGGRPSGSKRPGQGGGAGRGHGGRPGRGPGGRPGGSR